MTIRVYPGAKNPTHEISLSDGVRKWGLRLDGGAQAIQEVPMTASTLQFTGGGTKFGDWEPGMSHIEQRTWEGGRGQEEYVDAHTKFFDSMNAWTINTGTVFPVPQWKFAAGLRQSYEHLPGSVSWQALIGSKRHLSVSFTVGDTIFPVCRVFLWLKRVGSPGKVTVAIYTDNNGEPGALVTNAVDSVGIDTVRDVISRWQGFDVSACSSLAANTKYHIVVCGAESDGAANHWEVGIDTSSAASLSSSDGSAWAEVECSLYHRVIDLDIDRKWHLFIYKHGLYAIDQCTDGSPSKLYLNGDRGLATGGSSATLVDANKNWSANEWPCAWVGISAGTGIGQRAKILSNTSTTLTVDQWEISPDATSEYVIFNTPKWQDISPSSGDVIDGVVRDTAVIGDEALFAQGLSTNILRMRWNPAATPPAHEFADDGSNTADLLFPHVDSENGLHLWRTKNAECQISKAPLANWGTAYNYDSDIQVGFSSEPITNLYAHSGSLYAFKTDGRYWVKSDGTVVKSIGGIGFIPSSNNGEALLSHGLFTYYSWGGYSLQRLYDSGYSYDLASIGPDSDGGLPDERRGKISAIIGHPNGIIAVVNGGKERYSSVLMRPENNYGWHEVFRGWEAGGRIDNLFWQNIGDGRPRLWISVGGELVYQEWPQGAFNPLRDSGMDYCHEAVLVTSSIDLGAASLPKYLKEFSVLTKNLAAGVEIDLDYQIDENVGGENWIWSGTFYTHPEDSLPIHRGDVRKIRLRLRLQTNDRKIPPVIQATVLEGFARTPLKYQWNLRVKVGDTQRDLSGAGVDHDPDEFLTWLKEAAAKAKAIHMRSIWEQMDNKYVLVEPPTLLRSFTNNLLGFWGGSVNITLREN
jgi:hypothetical protein